MLNIELKASIVIPAYNAGDFIQRCLEALRKQTMERSKFEIIVVDDGSTDNTADILSSNNFIKFIKQSNQGPASARNRGAKEAKGEIILFLDADCEPTETWIEEMLKPFDNEENIVAVKGAYKTKQISLISRFTQVEFEYKYSKLSKVKDIDFVDSYSAAYKREIYLDMGGFDTTFTTACAEDADFSYKLAKLGYKMRFNPNAIVYHTHPSKLSNYLKRKYTYISWSPISIRKYPSHTLNNSYAPMSFKMQIILAPLMIFFIVLLLLDKKFGIIAIGFFFAFIIATTPFIVKSFRTDWKISVLSIFILFFRALVQFLGLLRGFMRILLKPKKI